MKKNKKMIIKFKKIILDNINRMLINLVYIQIITQIIKKIAKKSLK